LDKGLQHVLYVKRQNHPHAKEDRQEIFPPEVYGAHKEFFAWENVAPEIREQIPGISLMGNKSQKFCWE
jgi:hypothetical protein